MPANPALEAFVRTIPLFAYVEQATEMMEVVRLLKPVELNVGEVLFRQGEQGLAMWVLGPEAAVALTATRPGGQSVDVAALGEGDTLGELALIDHSGRSATATVARAGSAFVIPAEDFEALRQREAPVASKLLRKLSVDICDRLRMLAVRLEAGGGAQGKSPALPPGRPVPSEALDAFPAFRNLPATMRLALANGLQEHAVAGGTVLLEQHATVDSPLLLIEGQVAAMNGTRMVACLQPGSFLGLVPAVDGGTVFSTFKALTDVKVWRMKAGDFQRLFTTEHRACFDIVDLVARQLAAQLRQANAALLLSSTQGRRMRVNAEAVARTRVEATGGADDFDIDFDE